MKEEVDGEAHKDPVMGAILEDVEDGHGFVGESVHEEGFELALEVVADDHGNSELLVQVEGRI